MTGDRHGSLLLTAALLFVAGSAVGLGFALIGPVPLVRLLGGVAVLAGLAGAGLQVYALRELHPRAYTAWVQRVRAGLGRAASRGTTDTLPATA